MASTRRSGSGRVACIAGAAAVWMWGACGAAAPAAAMDLQKDVELLAGSQRAGKDGADYRLGVCVRDLKTGAVLAAINADDAFIPASNEKLLTSGTALSVLGPEYEFRTEFVLAPALKAAQQQSSKAANEDSASTSPDGAGRSTLIIKGCGDPAFADPELLDDMRMSPAAFVDSIATAIAGALQQGEEGTIGEIVVDDRVFDRQYVHATWPSNQLNRWYCAEVSGLNFHCNVLRIYASPAGRDGEKGIVTTDPEVPWLPIDDSRLSTITGKGSTAVGADRTAGTNQITVYGTVKQPLVTPIEVTVHEGSLIFARLLAERLEAIGAAEAPPSPLSDDVDEEGVDVRLVGADENLPAGRIVATVRTPLATVLERCNTDSHNLYAESLFKAAGHAATGQPGSWLNGAAVVRMQIQQRLGGSAALAATIADGSGMSRNNHVTPAFMTRWLGSIAADERIAATFIESLARPGAETGTLRNRFRHATLANKVRGKSGYLSGVRTLSGYVINEQTGRTVTFSILINDIGPKARHDKIKKLQEDIVEAVDDWLSDEVLSDPDSRPPVEAIGG